MKVLIQRVSRASCSVDKQITGRIFQGYCLFVGFCDTDTAYVLEKMVKKIIGLRIFSDEKGLMNLSIQQVNGSILSISQFTLYASCQKGNRPSFTQAARPEQALKLYEQFNAYLEQFVPVQKGIFGADMEIEVVNDGPVTIMLDSQELIK